MNLREKIVELSWMEPEVWEDRKWKTVVHVKAVLLKIFNPAVNEEDSLIVTEETEVWGTEGVSVRLKSRLRAIFHLTRDDRPMGTKKIVKLLMAQPWDNKDKNENNQQ